MRKLGLLALAAVAFLGITSSANAATALLQTNDFVGISFWLVSMGMIATTVFLSKKKNTAPANIPIDTNQNVIPTKSLVAKMAVAALAELVIPKNARAASAIMLSFFMKTSLSFSFL